MFCGRFYQLHLSGLSGATSRRALASSPTDLSVGSTALGESARNAGRTFASNRFAVSLINQSRGFYLVSSVSENTDMFFPLCCAFCHFDFFSFSFSFSYFLVAHFVCCVCVISHPPDADTPAFQQQALARALADVIRISVEKVSRGESLDLHALRNRAAAMNGVRPKNSPMWWITLTMSTVVFCWGFSARPYQ
jgi:hypothetical protein